MPATAPPADGTVQQLLLALYVLQDIARLDGAVGPDWIKRHGVLAGITGDNRKNMIRLIRRRECLACDQPLADSSTGDHVIALHNGDPAGVDNYLPLCGRCNSSKGTRDLLDWWLGKGRSPLDLGADVLCAYARLCFAQHRRLGTLNEPAPAPLQRTVSQLAQQLDAEQAYMLRQRVSWIAGCRW